MLEQEKLESGAELVRLVRVDSEARGRLRRSVAVSFSGLFRDPAQFDLLERELLPLLLASGEPLRVWSAGCADGSELYSVAILLERLGALERTFLLGSDLRLTDVPVADAGRSPRRRRAEGSRLGRRARGRRRPAHGERDRRRGPNRADRDRRHVGRGTAALLRREGRGRRRGSEPVVSGRSAATRSTERPQLSSSGSSGGRTGGSTGGAGGSGSFHGSCGPGGSGAICGGSPGRVGSSGGSGSTVCLRSMPDQYPERELV